MNTISAAPSLMPASRYVCMYICVWSIQSRVDVICRSAVGQMHSPVSDGFYARLDAVVLERQIHTYVDMHTRTLHTLMYARRHIYAKYAPARSPGTSPCRRSPPPPPPPPPPWRADFDSVRGRENEGEPPIWGARYLYVCTVLHGCVSSYACVQGKLFRTSHRFSLPPSGRFSC